MLKTGTEIDEALSWPIGRANRLAKRRQLPYVLLPDGEIRFDEEQVKSCLVRVPAVVKLEVAPCS